MENSDAYYSNLYSFIKINKMKLLQEFREKMGRNPRSYEELVGPVYYISFFKYIFELDDESIAGLIDCSVEKVRRALDHQYNMSLEYDEKIKMFEETLQIEPSQDTTWVTNLAVDIKYINAKKYLPYWDLKDIHDDEWDRMSKLTIILQLVHSMKQEAGHKMTKTFEENYAKMYEKYTKLMCRRLKRKIKLDEMQFEIKGLNALMYDEVPSLN
jgi:hypothetical protein